MTARTTGTVAITARVPSAVSLNGPDGPFGRCRYGAFASRCTASTTAASASVASRRTKSGITDFALRDDAGVPVAALFEGAGLGGEVGVGDAEAGAVAAGEGERVHQRPEEVAAERHARIDGAEHLREV